MGLHPRLWRRVLPPERLTGRPVTPSPEPPAPAHETEPLPLSWPARVAVALLLLVGASEVFAWPTYRLVFEDDAVTRVAIRGSPLFVHGLAALLAAVLLVRRPVWGSVLAFLVAASSASCLSCAWFGAFLPGDDGPSANEHHLIAALALVHILLAVLVASAHGGARARAARLAALAEARQRSAPRTF